jgi:hypothetical protein
VLDRLLSEHLAALANALQGHRLLAAAQVA